MGISPFGVCSCLRQEGIADTCSVHYPEDCTDFTTSRHLIGTSVETVMFRAHTSKAIELVREYEPTLDYITMSPEHVREFCNMMQERKLTWIAA